MRSNPSKTIVRCGLFAAALAASLRVLPSASATPISLGTASNFGVLEMGDGSVVEQATEGNNAMVVGDVGVAPPSAFNLTGGAKLYGNIWAQTSSQVTINNGGTLESGYTTKTGQSSVLSQAVTDALTAATNCGLAAVTASYSTIPTATLAAGVYDFTSGLNVSNYGTILSLGAPGQYILNITGNFTTGYGAGVSLLDPSEASQYSIIYNIIGSHSVSLNDDTIYGTVLAPTSTVTIANNEQLDGAILSGSTISINSYGVNDTTVVGHVNGGGNPIPDGGWTVELLGLAVCTAQYLRRKLTLA